MHRIANLPCGKVSVENHTQEAVSHPLTGWVCGGFGSFFGYSVPKTLCILKSRTRKRVPQTKGAAGDREGKKNMETVTQSIGGITKNVVVLCKQNFLGFLRSVLIVSGIFLGVFGWLGWGFLLILFWFIYFF